MNSKNKPRFHFLLMTYQAHHPLFFVLIPFLILSGIIGKIYQYYGIIKLDMSFFTGDDVTVSFQIMDGIILVSFAVISSVLVVIALKYSLERLLIIFFSIGLFLSPISILWLHGYFIDYYLHTDYFTFQLIFAIMGLIIGFLTLLVFTFNKGGKLAKNTLVTLLGIILGSMFGLILTLPTFLTLIILISIFDIYSVFKGPIHKMFQKANYSFRPILHNDTKKEIAIGIGDFIFYSALITFSSTNFGLAIGFAAITGLLLGVKITEKLLFKFGKFPGLPLPIFMSLLFIGFSFLISMFFINPLL